MIKGSPVVSADWGLTKTDVYSCKSVYGTW